MPLLSGRFSRSAGLLLLPPLAACAEHTPVAPVESPEPAAEVAKLQCTVQVRASSLTCATAAPTQAAGVRGAVMILGGQGYYVRLTSSGVSYDAGTGILRADVTVQSLLGQPIGTSDGTTPDTVRVFFESGPTRTAGTGSVEVANEHGTRTFTRSLQPYFNYPGILTTEQTSAPVEWRFSLPATVETFVFTVYVWAPVRDPLALRKGDRRGGFYPLGLGEAHSCAISSDGQAFCWGSNDDGQMGSAASDSVPVLVSGSGAVGAWYSLAAGRSHTCGVLFDQGFCWGDNQYGQLGTGSGGDSATPVEVIPGELWLLLTAGAAYTCGFGTVGVVCWGDGTAGQLATGDSASSATPVAVMSAPLDAGTDHSCTISAGRAAYCWGDNSAGQLGRAGPSTARAVLVGGSHSWRMVSAGDDFTCGITTDDLAMCWGSDSAGQLGNGAAPAGTTPVAVAGGRRWMEISAGRETACGITIAGDAYCWGYNGNGEVGDGSTTNRNEPVLLGGGSWAWISNGGDHTCGIRTDSWMLCWGKNQRGQLGDNSTVTRRIPVAVAGGPTWFGVHPTEVLP
jgi:alpha-tubulin suppressor-like RCC1 family protein